MRQDQKIRVGIQYLEPDRVIEAESIIEAGKIIQRDHNVDGIKLFEMGSTPFKNGISIMTEQESHVESGGLSKRGVSEYGASFYGNNG